MLIDFSVLKRELKNVLSCLDHTNLNDIQFFEQNPSAERIARYIYLKLVENLKEKNMDFSLSSSNGKISKVDVFETEKNRARFIPEK